MRLAAFIFATVLSIATPALADYRSEFASYRNALKDGDYDKASLHGEAAWRAAEKELGDHKLTAILAFNYAELVVIHEPAKACAPYERAKAISQKLDTGLIAEDIESGIALCEASAATSASPAQRRRLDVALSARREKKLPATPVSAHGHLLLARTEKFLAPMRRYADSALADAEALGGANYDKSLLRSALVYAGISRVSGGQHSPLEVTQAVGLFDRAFPLFPPQVDIDSFDRLLAAALSFRSSLSAIARSADEAPQTGTRLMQGDIARALKRAEANASDRDTWVRWQSDRPTCNLEYAKMQAPEYPSAALAGLQIGTILIGYDVRGTTIDRAIVLSDQFESGFGDAAVKAMKKWALSKPASVECEKNHLMYISFSIG